jgi:hypothetical protein
MGVYLINSLNIFYETYIHRVALRAPDKPIPLFIIEWIFSVVILIGVLKEADQSKILWNSLLFSSIVLIVLSLMEHFFLFYYSNMLNILFKFIASILTIFEIMRRSILKQIQLQLVWIPVIVSLVIAFGFTAHVYFVIR